MSLFANIAWNIALGTANEAKRQAVILAVGSEPVCHPVPSGVPDQPMTEEETILGAINRAKRVLAAVPHADIGLGLEGGLTYDDRFSGQWQLFSVCAAWDGRRLSLSKGLYMPLPEWMAERLQQEGIELRVIMDEVSGTSGTHQKEGAYGVLTGGRITRAHIFRDAVIAALTPFASDLYRKGV